jgi:hypothetical protein
MPLTAVNITSQLLKHTCGWPHCKKQVPFKIWGCQKHWKKLPKDLQKLIYKTYNSDKFLETEKQINEFVKSTLRKGMIVSVEGWFY